MLAPAFPKFQSFSRTRTSSIHLSTPYKLYTLETLSFPRKPCSNSSLSSSLSFSPHDQQLDDVLDEEHVVGDCVVFEEGAFEDPYLQQSFDPSESVTTKKQLKSSAEIKHEDLVPEKWKEIQAEINITKKERRRLAQEIEFRTRVEKRKQGLVPISNVRMEDYAAYRDEKLSQLKPIVLDKPSSFSVADEEKDNGLQCREGGGDDDGSLKSGSRVVPRNPRLAVYRGSLDDITEFFNSGNYDPSAARKTEGRRKLFTKEEKILLNRRIPELSAATSSKWLPLHTLVASGEFYLMNTLLKHNVDINAKDKDGLTALHKATLSKKQAIFNYLLRESADPFVCDDEGASLMHYAVRAASSQMIKILLLYNVDINVQDNDGWTPLHVAVQTRRTDIVRLLLIKGADKTLKNKDGLTPLDICLYSGGDIRTYELIKLLKQLPKQRRLV